MSRRDFPRTNAEWLKDRRTNCLADMKELAKITKRIERSTIDVRLHDGYYHRRQREGALKELFHLEVLIGELE